jgi:hypothetical protein
VYYTAAKMLKNNTTLVIVLSEAYGLVLILLEVWKAQKRDKNESKATKTQVQARYSVIGVDYFASNKNKLVATIIEKKILNTDTPFWRRSI